MVSNIDQSPEIVISEDSARGAVAGHNVRYVLAWGLTGIVAAFAAVGIYFGYDRLQENISQALAQNPSEVVRAIAPFATIIVVGAVMAGLLLGLWNLISGRSENASQTGMRLRVVTQFALICVIMTILYATA